MQIPENDRREIHGYIVEILIKLWNIEGLLPEQHEARGLTKTIENTLVELYQQAGVKNDD